MNNKQTGAGKKKRSSVKPLLIVALSALIVLVLALGTFVAIFYIEDSKPVCWKSGEVIIDGHALTLPCSAEEFEKELHVTIPEGDYFAYISTVTVDGSDGPVTFKVFRTDDLGTVKGITVDADDIGDRDAVVFPGGVTLDSDINAANELYSTKPLNIYFNYWGEDIIYREVFSEGFRYVDYSSFEVELKTSDSIMEEIFYCWIADE